MAKATKDLIRAHGIEVQFLLDEEDTGGSSTAFMCRVAPGGQTPPPHSHDGWDELVYCTEGEFLYAVEGVETVLAVGDALSIQRGQVHEFNNVGEVDACMLVVSTPGLFHESYFRSMTAILNVATDGPPDFAALGRVMAEHGVSPAMAPA